MPNWTSQKVSLTVSDGSSMDAFVARPERPKAGLIVFQEAFGVNAHIRDVTERFAAEGYLAIAPELFHRTAPGFEGSYTDFDAVRGHMAALTEDGLSADAAAAHAWLEAEAMSSISAIGYCLGGRAAFLAATALPLKAAVSYYGGGIAPNERSQGLLHRTAQIQCPILTVWGGKDAHIGPDAIGAIEQSLRDAGKDYVNVVVSYADHGFFCDARASYSPTAAATVWPLTLAFLAAYEVS